MLSHRQQEQALLKVAVGVLDRLPENLRVDFHITRSTTDSALWCLTLHIIECNKEIAVIIEPLDDAIGFVRNFTAKIVAAIMEVYNAKS